MNVLGLDTCFGALSVAVGADLGRPSARVVSRTEPMATGHAERLLPLVETLLAEAQLQIRDVERVAVTNGPGSFTGSRIGIAAARALRLALGTPIVTFSSLEAMALGTGFQLRPEEDLWCAVDARRGDAYLQVFDGTTRTPAGPPAVHPVGSVAALFGSHRPVLVVGTAAQVVADVLLVSDPSAAGAVRVRPGTVWPDMAAAVVKAALQEPAMEPVVPLYLRPPDAKPQDGKSLPRAAT